MRRHVSARFWTGNPRYHRGVRVDHVLHAVADLPAAIATFRDRLGMAAAFGGVHPGRGTHNGLVHFGTGYLELIGVTDPSAERGGAIARHCAEGDAPYSFALAVADLAMSEADLPTGGSSRGLVRPGGRRTAEGADLRWRSADLAPPSDVVTEMFPLPFLIEWTLDDAGRQWMAERRSLARHPLPYGPLRAITIAVHDARVLAPICARWFGWEIIAESRSSAGLSPGGTPVNEDLGPGAAIVLRAPDGDSAADRAIRERLRRHGPGFAGIVLGTGDGPGLIEGLRGRGVGVERDAASGRIAIDPAGSHGLLIEIDPV